MPAIISKADIRRREWQVRFVPILLQKSFWEGERKLLEPLMHFARGEVRTISFHPKSITDLRSGVEKRRNSREVKDQLSRDF
jgi:hypothetical protein